MNRLLSILVLLLSLVAISLPSAQSQNGLTLTTTNVSRMPGVSPEMLELVAMDEPGGTTQEVGEENLTKLNDYFAGGWRQYDKTLNLGGKRIGVYGTIVIPAVEGFCIIGGGIGDTRAENQYASVAQGGSGIGGSVGGFVNLMPANPVLIDYGGKGLELIAIKLDGWWHATSLDALRAATSSHALVGILQRCNPGNGVGAGKVQAKGLVITCCEVAILLGDSEEGDNADQWCITSLRTPDCRVGLKSICIQSVGHGVAQYEGLRVGTMFQFWRGGKLVCLQATMESADQTLLETRGQNTEEGIFEFQHIYVDNNATGQAYLWKMLPKLSEEQFSKARLKIGLLSIGANISTAPLVVMRGYGTLQIDAGEDLFDRFIEIHSSGVNFRHDVFIEKARFRSGEDPANVIVNDNGLVDNVDGFCNVETEGCRTANGVRFPNNYFEWNNGVSTEYDPNEPDARVSLPRPAHWIEPSAHHLAIAA